MNISIIGAGNVGRSLAASSVRAGHSVVVASSDPQDAEGVAQATGARTAPSNAAAVHGADIVILAVPFTAAEAIVDELGDALAGKIVVDVTNPFTPELTGLAGTSVAEQLQARLPNARVVKAFNTVFAARQADPVVDGVQLDAFVAGDDGDAKALVLELAESIGFRAIDAGPLALARNLEGLALLGISLQIHHGWSWQNGWKLVGPTALAA